MGRNLFQRLMRDPMGVVGLVLVTIVIGCAIFAPWLAPFDPAKIDVTNKFAPISSTHWLGTDHLGRDTLSRIIYGSRVAMALAISSVAISATIGLGVGLAAGYGPRWFDGLVLFFIDTLSSIPLIFLALAVIAVAGPGIGTLMLVIVAVSVPGYSRLVRSQTLALRSADFVVAERALGAGTARILGVHLLPNVVGPLIIMASMDIPTVVALEAALSFLGMGVKPPTPSWGAMLFDGYTSLQTTSLPVIAAGLPLIMATLGFTFLGEALRDILDPKLARRGL